MSYKELEQLFKEMMDSDEGFEDDPKYNKKLQEHGIQLVHSVAGYEGGGEEVERVFEKEGIFIQVTGTYSSYDGITWDDVFTQVYAKRRTITAYEKEG